MARKLNGRATPLTNYDMVPDEQRLQILLDSARNNRDVRRPDGSKSPALLACEEIFRLQNELYSYKAQIELWALDYKQLTTDYANQQWIQSVRKKSRWFRLGRWLGFYR